jgi:cell division protein FtsZ
MMAQQPGAAYAAMSRPREEREVMVQQAAPAVAQAMQHQPLQAAVGHSYPAPRMSTPQTPGFNPGAPAMRVEPAPRPSAFDTRPAPRIESRPLPPASELPFAAPSAPEPGAVEPPHADPAPAEPPRFDPPRFESARFEQASPEPQPAIEAAQPAAEKKRGPNIFTRAANRALDLARQTSSDLRDATPSAVMTRMAKPDPVIRSSAPAPQPATPPAVQTRLALDPTDRIASRPSEEDMLDIPAFLRRQAN